MKTLTRGHFKAGFDSVRSTKLRSFWTMMGVIIGVTSVITVVSIGEGIKQQITNQINHFGENIITIRPAQLRTAADSGSNGLNLIAGLNVSAPLGDKDVKAVKKTKGVESSAPLSVTAAKVKGNYGLYNDGFVVGTSANLPGLIKQSLAYGTFFEEDDEDLNVAVLGQHAVDQMFDTDVPLGRSFTINGKEFIVRGIFSEFTPAPLSQQADFDKAIFIPFGSAKSVTNNTAPIYSILARPDKSEDSGKVAAQISSSLAKSHGSDNGFEVLTGDQNLSTSGTILDLLTRMVAGIAAISLLVGGIGIMNVMLVSVAERMHEIGIRKAVGATNRQIMNQFIVESSVLTLTGGIIGIIASLLINLGLRLTTDLKPVISWEIVVVATGVSLLIGIIFGTLPAVKAARKDPIEALRSE